MQRWLILVSITNKPFVYSRIKGIFIFNIKLERRSALTGKHIYES